MAGAPALEGDDPLERQRRIRRFEEPGYLPTSHSALSNFHRCPALYRFSLDHDRMGGDAAQMGTVVHSYAESGELEFGNELRLGQDPDFWRLIRNFDRLGERSYEEGGLMPGGEQEREMFIEWDIHAGLRCQLRAFLDQYDVQDGWGLVDDYKTGQKIDDEDHGEQRRIYALAAVRNDRRIWRGVKVRTIYLRWGKIVSETLDLVAIERFSLVLEGKVKELASCHESGDFPTRPAPNSCRLCDFAHKCDAAQRLLQKWELELKGGRIVIPEHVGKDRAFLADMVRAKYHLDKLTSDLQATLKKGLTEGAIEVPELGGKWAGWETASKRIRDVNRFRQILLERGEDPSEYMTIDYNRARWLIERDPELSEAAEEVPSRYPKYEFRKVKDQ